MNSFSRRKMKFGKTVAVQMPYLDAANVMFENGANEPRTHAQSFSINFAVLDVLWS